MMRKNGFTLVELSIVLVIIGLLIGGILVGQSLIESAKINRFIRDIQQYEVMVDQFKFRYKNLPGDNNLFPVADRGGAVSADGLIALSDNTGFISSLGQPYDSEINNFWPHLSQSGISQKIYTPISTNSTADIVVGENLPEVFGGAGLYVYSKEAVSIMGFNSPIAHFFGLAKLIKPSIALAIDIKMDDGVAGTDGTDLGGTQLSFLSDEVVTMNAGSDGDCHVSSDLPLEYNPSNDNEVCFMLIGFNRKR